jgi:hypothetical protein
LEDVYIINTITFVIRIPTIETFGITLSDVVLLVVDMRIVLSNNKATIIISGKEQAICSTIFKNC